MTPHLPERAPAVPALRSRRRTLAALALAAALTASSAAAAPRAFAENPGSDGAVAAAAVVAGAVEIHGTAAVGQTVTAVPTGWTPAETTYAYQWAVDGAPVGTDAPALLLDAAWVGRQLTVAVTGTGPDTTTGQATSDPVQVATGQFSTGPAPTLSGAVRVDSTVLAQPGAWSPTATFSYQWRRDGAAISGATGHAYRPVAADRGRALSVRITAVRPGYAPATRTSASATVGAGVFGSAPSPAITGASRVGALLTARPGTWSPAASLSYRWFRSGTAIRGATAATYRLVAADHTRRITVRVTAARAGYPTTSRTSPASPVVAKPFDRVTVPTISGVARVGATLTAAVAAWSPTASFAYQWRRGGVPIPGAVGRTYRLAPADHQRHITVTVTGKRAAYVPTSRTSQPTGKIAPPPPTLTRNGTFGVGTGVPAGVYVSKPSEFCYWERRSTAGSDLAGIIANDLGSGQRIVRIAASDRYFVTDGCGTWTRLVPLAVPRQSMSDGVYAVVSHIRPGLYRAPGSRYCYWARLSGFSAELHDIIDNSIASGQQEVQIYAGDVGFVSSGCGTWTRIGD